jgi:thiamine-monophosphate kinase
LRDLIESHPGNRRILNDIGDDAAVWQPSRSHRSVVTSDALVEDVHFRRESMPLRDIGWRAMASNISDLAAMGARPVWATVAIGVPESLSGADVLEIYRGMLDVAVRHGCALAGGDTTRSPQLFLSIAAAGEVRPSHLKGRGGALPRDIAAVTGALGASRAGLHLADNVNMIAENLREEALSAHRRPEPRLAEGRWLAAGAHVHAMMDVSDGLSTDLQRMAVRSGLAAVVDEVPVAASAAAMAQARGEDPQAYALAGGEDYELLVAVAPRAFEYVSAQFAKRFKRPLIAVGHFREGSGLFARKGDAEEPLASSGWDHLA